jgi:multiple sugar transport system permease protein
VWTTQPVGRWLANSALVVIAAVPGAVVSSTLVAYAFARYHFPGRDVLFLVVLSTLMLPEEVTLIPQYIIFQRYFGWIDTYWPLIVPAWSGGGALSIFLMRQFLMSIPRDLDDAARIDGANALQILLLVLVPLCRPALATVAILQFLKHWNDFMGPFIFLSSPERFTMALGLRFFQTIPETVGAPKEHLLMAATVLMALPAVLLFFAAQRHFVRGMVMSGIKG